MWLCTHTTAHHGVLTQMGGAKMNEKALIKKVKFPMFDSNRWRKCSLCPSGRPP